MRKEIGFEEKDWKRPGRVRPGQVARMRKNIGFEKKDCPALQIGQAGPAPFFFAVGSGCARARPGQARPGRQNEKNIGFEKKILPSPPNRPGRPRPFFFAAGSDFTQARPGQARTPE